MIPPDRLDLPLPDADDAGPTSAWATLAPDEGEDPVSDRSPAALPAVIDVEASGFGRHSYPIEIGFVLEDGRAGCTLIRPEPDWTHWDASAEHTHRIGRDTLLRHGRPAADVAAWLNRHLAGRTVYTDGWAHDYAWIARLFDAAHVSPRFRLGHLRTLLDDAQASAWQRRLDDLRREGGGERHRASIDARQIRAALAHALPSR